MAAAGTTINFLDALKLYRGGLFTDFRFPIPANRVIGGFGDSRISMNHSGSGGNDFIKSFGWAHWLQAYSKGVASVPVAYNGGVAGNTTKEMYARQLDWIATYKAAGVNLVVVAGSTNDRTGDNLSLGDSKRYLREIVRRFQLAGIEVILVSETPRGNGSSSYELTASQKADHYAMHLWIEEEMSKMCVVANVWDAWIDPASGTNYYPLASMVRDGIHPSKIGAQAWGRVLAPLVRAYVRGLGDLLESNTLYNASSAPLGSLSPNPMMTGTGGSIASSCNPVAGSVLAANWGAEANNMAGLTTTWSKETDARNVTWQKCVVTGTAGSNVPELTLFSDVSLASLVNGDKVKSTGLVRTVGSGLSAAGQALLLVPSYTQKLDGDDSDPSLPWPSDDTGVLHRESPVLNFLTASNHTLIRTRVIFTFQAGAAVNATLWVSKCGAFKVAY